MKQRQPPKHILISPLDWGLGHASRIIPLIHQLQLQGHKVTIAANHKPLALLLNEFPNLTWVPISSYNVHYPTHNNYFAAKIALQIPKILLAIYREHAQLNKILKQHAIDLVISDNRYGLFSRHTTTVFITHQIQIQMPSKLAFLSRVVRWVNTMFINQFDSLWIPDQANHALSGLLSRTNLTKLQPHFLGNLSRFSQHKPKLTPQYKTEILVVLSGPEPQRSLFESILLHELQKTEKTSLVVRGLPSNTPNRPKPYNDNIRTVEYLNTAELASAVLQAELIICRSGYSSIMDLVALQKTALLVPTPGQTEQEYLAHYHQQKGWFLSQKQHEINLPKALLEIKGYKIPSGIATNLEMPPV